MRDIVFSPKANRLVYLDQKATPEFWDSRWENEGKPAPINPRDHVITVTREYLKPGARILEGGCGRANKVKALVDAGFDVVGVDFAEETVRRAKQTYGDIDVRRGDVRSLAFPDEFFDGYWSIGVIEHFWTGYDAILAEAARVLKPGGVLFLTAPWFSPYRQRRARAGAYPTRDYMEEPDSFYQYGLGREEVCAQLERHGFHLLRWSGLAAEISLKDDVKTFRRQIAWLFDSRGSIAKRILRRAITVSMNPHFGHSFLAVARRIETSPRP